MTEQTSPTVHYCQDCERRFRTEYVAHLQAHGITTLRCEACAAACGQVVPHFERPVNTSYRFIDWHSAATRSRMVK